MQKRKSFLHLKSQKYQNPSGLKEVVQHINKNLELQVVLLMEERIEK